jgi:hypothetical protein
MAGTLGETGWGTFTIVGGAQDGAPWGCTYNPPPVWTSAEILEGGNCMAVDGRNKSGQPLLWFPDASGVRIDVDTEWEIESPLPG